MCRFAAIQEPGGGSSLTKTALDQLIIEAIRIDTPNRIYLATNDIFKYLALRHHDKLHEIYAGYECITTS